MAKLRLKLSNPNEIRKALSRIANLVLNGEIDPRQGNCITLVCNGILSSFKYVELKNDMEGSGFNMRNETDAKVSAFLRLAELCGTGDDKKKQAYMQEVERLLGLDAKKIQKVLSEIAV